MKFQNPSLNFFLSGRKNKRTSRKQYAPHFFKVGAIKSQVSVYRTIGCLVVHDSMNRISHILYK